MKEERKNISMLEENAKQVLQALQYCTHLTYKATAVTVTFYYESERYSRPIFLRSFHKNNFKKDNKFYVEFDKVLRMIKGDYYYVDNRPI